MSTARLKQTKVGVTSKYGPRPRFTVPHKGTDFAFGRNTPVSAFGAGRVTFAGRAPYYIPGTKKRHPNYERGLYVEIEHAPGIATSYHSADRLNVKTGDMVQMGDTVCWGGTSAVGANGDHCHIGLWLNGQHVDLELYLIPGVIVTISNTGQVSSGGSTPFDNSTPAPTPIPARIDPEDTLMKIMRQDGGVIALVGEHTAEQYAQFGAAEAFSIGVNTKAYGATTGLTKDEVTTLITEARARRAKFLADVASTVATAVQGHLKDLKVTAEVDVDAIAQAVANEDHRRSAS